MTFIGTNMAVRTLFLWVSDYRLVGVCGVWGLWTLSMETYASPYDEGAKPENAGSREGPSTAPREGTNLER